MDKQQLRQLIRQRKKEFTTEEKQRKSAFIIQHLLAHPKLAEAQTILLYYSLPDEVDTHQCIEDLYQQGKTILLPKVVGDGIMEIRLYQGIESLAMGSYNIMEPNGPIITDYQTIDLAIVPGMSFDTNHNRLGRGKGYYDRFLTQIPYVYKIGICYDFQKVEAVPHNVYDIPMDEVLASEV